MSKTVLVCGMARCGTSLTLQMLHACGLRCAGDFPAFEPPEINLLLENPSAAWLESYDAVKIIDPHRGRLPQIDCAIIWLDRNPKQQARSQVKCLSAFSGFAFDHDAAEKAMERSLRQDRRVVLNALPDGPRLITSFEDAILDSLSFATSIATFLAPWHHLSVDKMIACVRPRRNSVKCEPTLEIEQELCR
jgi:hypothetical protein